MALEALQGVSLFTHPRARSLTHAGMSRRTRCPQTQGPGFKLVTFFISNGNSLPDVHIQCADEEGGNTYAGIMHDWT